MGGQVQQEQRDEHTFLTDKESNSPGVREHLAMQMFGELISSIFLWLLRCISSLFMLAAVRTNMLVPEKNNTRTCIYHHSCQQSVEEALFRCCFLNWSCILLHCNVNYIDNLSSYTRILHCIFVSLHYMTYIYIIIQSILPDHIDLNAMINAVSSSFSDEL